MYMSFHPGGAGQVSSKFVFLKKWACVLCVCVFKLVSHIMVACKLAHLVAHLITAPRAGSAGAAAGPGAPRARGGAPPGNITDWFKHMLSIYVLCGQILKLTNILFCPNEYNKSITGGERRVRRRERARPPLQKYVKK